MKKEFEVRAYRSVGVTASVVLDVPNDDYIPTVEDIEEECRLTWLEWVEAEEWWDKDVTVYEIVDTGEVEEEEQDDTTD